MQMTQQSVAGVDWAGGEWIAVIFADGSYSECILEYDFGSLWDEVPELDHMLIDVPIGLPSDQETLADRDALNSLARSVTGRSSSVFPVPSRKACKQAYNGKPYETVAATNRDIIEKGLSKQSYQIASAIAEVDAFLQDNDLLSETVVESHPEVCFRGLLGEQLRHSKQTAAGVGERFEALDGHLDTPGTVFQTICRELSGKSTDATADDVIDALGLAVTAWRTRDDPKYLPQDPEYDAEGLPMQMVYWSEELLA